jgi:hypothetical protein
MDNDKGGIMIEAGGKVWEDRTRGGDKVLELFHTSSAASNVDVYVGLVEKERIEKNSDVSSFLEIEHWKEDGSQYTGESEYDLIEAKRTVKVDGFAAIMQRGDGTNSMTIPLPKKELAVLDSKASAGKCIGYVDLSKHEFPLEGE